MSHPAQHLDQPRKIQRKVYLVGTASTTYKKGIAVAYNRDYGTATTREGSRDKRVEPISQSNNLRFAGVIDSDVALDSTGQGWAVINEPRSVCDIALGSDSVVDTTLLWFTAGTGGAGRWRSDKGIGLGRGCARALQTNASGNIGESIDGTAVVNGTAVTDTGLFANAAAGDKLVIMASASAAGAAGATVGEYTISSVTDDDNAVLSTSASSGAVEFAGYVISGNPTCLAELLDGEETGGIEWIESLNNAASQSMVGGFTHILGGVTLGTGDCTSTLADGTYIGQKKGFLLHGALTTQDYLLTVTTSPNIATAEFDADADELLLEWGGADGWSVKEASGVYTVAMAAGTGIVGYAEMIKSQIYHIGEIIKTEIIVDLTGLSSTATAGDIIGELDGPGTAYIGQITAAKNGTIFMGKCTSLELPATGDDDIMIYSADEGTGVEDGAIGDLTETQLCDPAAAWATGLVKGFVAVPTANQYLYLVSNGDTAGTYTAGKLLIELWGV